MANKKSGNYILRMQQLQQRRRGQAKGDRFAADAAARQRKIEGRVGKKLIVPESVMLEMIRTNKVPTMIKHCVLAVMFKKRRKLRGTPKEQFLSAFNICCATFAKHGYLSGRGSINMTGRGMRRNRCHQREKVANKKKGRYNGVVNKLWTPQLDQARFAARESKRVARNARDRMARMKQRRKAKGRT